MKKVILIFLIACSVLSCSQKKIQPIKEVTKAPLKEVISKGSLKKLMKAILLI